MMKETQETGKPYRLSQAQQDKWKNLVHAGELMRQAKWGDKADRHRVDKNGGVALNKDDESHARACAYLLLMACARMRVKQAVQQSGMDWITLMLLKDHCQEYHDAYCAMMDAQKTRVVNNARGLTDAVMDGEEVSNAQGRMASWALERLDDDFKPAPAAHSAAQAGQGAIGGGIVINLVAQAANPCDNLATLPSKLVQAPVNIGSGGGLPTLGNDDCDDGEMRSETMRDATRSAAELNHAARCNAQRSAKLT